VSRPHICHAIWRAFWSPDGRAECLRRMLSRASTCCCVRANTEGRATGQRDLRRRGPDGARPSPASATAKPCAEASAHLHRAPACRASRCPSSSPPGSNCARHEDLGWQALSPAAKRAVNRSIRLGALQLDGGHLLAVLLQVTRVRYEVGRAGETPHVFGAASFTGCIAVFRRTPWEPR